jgi:hypothetical protein
VNSVSVCTLIQSSIDCIRSWCTSNLTNLMLGILLCYLTDKLVLNHHQHDSVVYTTNRVVLVVVKYQCNWMKLNTGKMRIITFMYIYKLCDFCITWTDSIKDSGVLIDSKLYFH